LFQITCGQDFKSNNYTTTTYDFLGKSYEKYSPTTIPANTDTSQFLIIKETILLNYHHDSYFMQNAVNSKLNFDSQINEKQTLKSTFEIDTNLSFKPYYFKSDELNKHLIIPQITYVENSFTDYTDDIRGCGPLEDGFTKTLNSRDIMLSNIFDNFINNIVFNDGGPLNMIIHPKN
jgi:hypothetical protein